MVAGKAIEQRLKSLEDHLEQENPVLLRVVQSFRRLDQVAYRMGLLDREQSYATRIPWWPLISILGTFSAGKSTFINHYLGQTLQSTGNQAVDDKFTVVCFSGESTVHVLPGLALDADPRFPFFRISHEIEKVAAGEGRRIDAYLQLKTSDSDRIRGKILIDSPGFDADAQRTSTLRITDHIIDLSDLVLVLFDARHPEPGAMQDTLQHLVADTVSRPDSNKFLYILNQLDTTAREDNPEDVVAAWQRALAQKGLTAGRFYTIYNPDAAVPIEDEALRRRFEGKRDADLAAIHERIRQVEVERAYRIVGALEKQARDIEERLMPKIRDLVRAWRRRVLWVDGVLLAVVAAAVLGASFWLGFWDEPVSMRLDSVFANPWAGGISAAVVLLLAGLVHYRVRSWSLRVGERQIRRELDEGPEREGLIRALQRNTRPWRSLFQRNPAGWGRGARNAIKQVLHEANMYVQSLNDRFTNPSGVSVQPTGMSGERPAPEAMEVLPATPTGGSPDADAPVSGQGKTSAQ